LDGIRGQFSSCKEPSKDIGHIRVKLQNQFEKFEEDKARQKEINAKIGRKRQLARMRMNHTFEF
jgi:hypothetical protein